MADDQLGKVFRHDMRATGIDFDTPAREGEPATGRVLIFVTPDGERTMNTFLGAGQYLPASALDEDLIESAAILYLEGYLWDPEEPRRAMRRAIEVARNAGRKVAFTASESFVIERHRDDFCQMLDDGVIDILFVNESELATLTGEDDFEAGLAWLKDKVPVLVAPRSEKGAVAIAHGERADVAAVPVLKVVDTTGAGDAFAAGVLTAAWRTDPGGASTVVLHPWPCPPRRHPPSPSPPGPTWGASSCCPAAAARSASPATGSVTTPRPTACPCSAASGTRP